jgi:hypothetical protein
VEPSSAIERVKSNVGFALVICVAVGFLSIPAAIVADFLGISKLWALLTVPAAFVAIYLKRWIVRIWQLNRRGHHAAVVGNPLRIVYEEMNIGVSRKLEFPLDNTEPGHWEWFVLDEEKWEESVPEWARTRRTEIVGRMRTAMKPSDVHC